MITILVNNLNAMIVTTNEPIMQHSKNAHPVRIFVPITYNGHDMSLFTASLEVVPPNQKYKTFILYQTEKSEKEGYIQYDLDITADYTLFAGDISMQMTFVYTDELMKTFVRHTQSCTLPVLPIEKWSELITDESLSALDQRLVAIEEGIKYASDLADYINTNKADNIAINEDGDVQLKSNGNYIGDAIPVVTPSTIDDEDTRHDGMISADDIYEI